MGEAALETAAARVAQLAMALATAGGAEQARLMESYSEALAELEALTEAQIPLHEVEPVLAGLGLGDVSLDTPVASLSGGQKTRLGLVRLLLHRPQILLLDEPTNHLDIPSRAKFEQAMRAFEGTVLAAVHDRYFIRGFATRVWAIHDGTLRYYLDLEEL